jgi:hypothetical protein
MTRSPLGGAGMPLACEIVTRLPATVSEALRAAPVLAATDSVIAVEPVRVPPGAVIQDGAPVVFHAQADDVATDTVRLPPDAVTEALLGVTV